MSIFMKTECLYDLSTLPSTVYFSAALENQNFIYILTRSNL
uniref:Uncharacterized protein n=1 Tax=Arundo donax TaxID=35708 RepID=A0A0A9FG14_ARUDO